MLYTILILNKNNLRFDGEQYNISSPVILKDVAGNRRKLKYCDFFFPYPSILYLETRL